MSLSSFAAGNGSTGRLNKSAPWADVPPPRDMSDVDREVEDEKARGEHDLRCKWVNTGGAYPCNCKEWAESDALDAELLEGDDGWEH